MFERRGRRGGRRGGRRLLGGALLAERDMRRRRTRPPSQKHHVRHAGNDAEQRQDPAGHAERARLAEDLRHDLLAHVVRPGDAGHQNGDRDGEQQRRNLRHQAVADREQGVGAARVRQRHSVLRGADDGAAEQIDEDDENAGDRVAAHELAGAVHGAVEVRFFAHFLAARDGLGLRDDAGIQIRIDGHLPARHGIQGESRAHFRDAAGALGDDHEIDDHQHDEHHHADGVVAAHDELAEGGDDVAGRVRAGVPVHEHDARRGHIEPQAQQGCAQQHGRERREFERAVHIDDGQQDDERQRNVEREKDVEKKCRQRQHHHGDDRHHHDRHAQAVAGKFAEGCHRVAAVHTSAYSSPTVGSGRAMRAARVGFKVRILKM